MTGPVSLIPTNGWIWVSRDPGVDQVGSIVVPDRYRGVGEVAHVRYSDDPDFPPSTIIVLGRHSGERIVVGEEVLWAVRPEEIVAMVVTPDEGQDSDSRSEDVEVVSGTHG